MADDHDPAVGSGHAAGDGNSLVIGENFEQFKVLHGRGFVAQLTGHPKSLAHAAGKRAITDRAAVAEILVGAARVGKTLEMMAPDNAGIAAPLRHPGDIDQIAGLTTSAAV